MLPKKTKHTQDVSLDYTFKSYIKYLKAKSQVFPGYYFETQEFTYTDDLLLLFSAIIKKKKPILYINMDIRKNITVFEKQKETYIHEFFDNSLSDVYTVLVSPLEEVPAKILKPNNKLIEK